VPFPEVMQKAGIIPGIKVDQGAKDMAGHRGEKITEGLDGLRERLAEYRKLGARFAKWRAVITIGKGIPCQRCIDANARPRASALCRSLARRRVIIKIGNAGRAVTPACIDKGHPGQVMREVPHCT
jgi:fructose-bisphosphate aldolase class I